MEEPGGGTLVFALIVTEPANDCVWLEGGCELATTTD
jgi:hypothetical protein